MGLTAILESEEQAEGCTHNKRRSREIHVEELVLESSSDRLMGGRTLEDEGNDGRSHSTDGKIDIEAPRVDIRSDQYRGGRAKNQSRPVSCNGKENIK